jgi:hypothetical protein
VLLTLRRTRPLPPQSNRAEQAKSLVWAPTMRKFPHPALDATSIVGFVIGPFIFAACMFSFVTQAGGSSHRVARRPRLRWGRLPPAAPAPACPRWRLPAWGPGTRAPGAQRPAPACAPQLGMVVTERELGLRQALANMGMTDLAYWASWQAWDVTMAFITSHLICIFGQLRWPPLPPLCCCHRLLPSAARRCCCDASGGGCAAQHPPPCPPAGSVHPNHPPTPPPLPCAGLILQFSLFKRNDYGILFFLFFLFQMSMNSVAYLLSTIIRKSQTAVYTGFLIFLVGWICQVDRRGAARRSAHLCQGGCACGVTEQRRGPPAVIGCRRVLLSRLARPCRWWSSSACPTAPSTSTRRTAT